jgi:hypothetical protein
VACRRACRGHPEDLDRTYNSHSIGHWEGQDLLVDAAGMKEEIVLAQAGERRWRVEVPLKSPRQVLVRVASGRGLALSGVQGLCRSGPFRQGMHLDDLGGEISLFEAGDSQQCFYGARRLGRLAA